MNTSLASRMAALVVVAALTNGCAADTGTSTSSTTAAGTLALRGEKKLDKLFSGALPSYEASGLSLESGRLRVVFDNATHVGSVDPGLLEGTLGAGEVTSSNFEAVTGNGSGGLFVARETRGAADPRGGIVEIDASGARVADEPTDVTFADPNRGFEGLVRLRVGNEDLLLALCEGNACNDGKSGNGRIHVLGRDGGVWKSREVLSLPTSVDFDDYSDLAVRALDGGTYTLAVLSQQSSAVWLGTLGTAPFAISAGGTRYDLPRTSSGKLTYCNAEGVAFVDTKLLAIASDKADQGGDCKDHDESIALFALP